MDTPIGITRFMAVDTHHFDNPPAVVVGACAHGLAMVDGLVQAGIETILVESNPNLPGLKTHRATIHFVPSIEGANLVEALLSLRATIHCPDLPVLLLTNDTMVRDIGLRLDSLVGHYRISWSNCAEALLPLLGKDNLESRCKESGLNYPRSQVIEDMSDLDTALEHVGFPLIIKPVKPLSRFKTCLPDTRESARHFLATHTLDFPIIVQTFIPGDDRSIYFSAIYFEDGKVLARFDGHKLRSWPMGHTTIAEAFANDEVHGQALRFFQGLNLTGPVSLELKKDSNGKYWVIEPTVGRTDFWIGLCIANKVNLPAVEYLHQVGSPIQTTQQADQAVWFNEERDPYGFFWFLTHPALHFANRKPTFCYLNHPESSVRRVAREMVLRGLLRPLYRRIHTHVDRVFFSKRNKNNQVR